MHRYPGTSCLATISLSLRDAIPFQRLEPILAELVALSASGLARVGEFPWVNPGAKLGHFGPQIGNVQLKASILHRREG
jgi:hypothetical protein